MMEQEIGVIEHYFSKIGVAAIKITDGSLKIGDRIHIKGATTDFEQTVESMEINRQKIEIAKPGDEIGIKVIDRVREGDKVYKIE
ncbi:MAG TPA: translation elongation factor-like protein [Thermoplasmata archaeon]|nr:translation elongation factor-like protein [Thermoplasmata archaeon]